MECYCSAEVKDTIMTREDTFYVSALKAISDLVALIFFFFSVFEVHAV